MKELTHHKTNGLNNGLKIEVLDEQGAGGAHHRYEVTGFDTASNPSTPLPEGYYSSFNRLMVLFQNGSPTELGTNGITNEVLLAILIDRMEGFCNGPFKCGHNNAALHHLHCALAELKKRTRKRVDSGVEGTHWVLCADEMPGDETEVMVRTPSGEFRGYHDSGAGGWYTDCFEFFRDEVVSAWKHIEPELDVSPVSIQEAAIDTYTTLLVLLADIRVAAGDTKGKLTHSELVEHIRNLRAECDEARAELAELREDKARLDEACSWLDNQTIRKIDRVRQVQERRLLK